jgi:hypothetical protein
MLTKTLWATSRAIGSGAKVDSIDFYVHGDGAKLTAASELALLVLVVPAGEASSERVFSAAASLYAAHTLRTHILQNK